MFGHFSTLYMKELSEVRNKTMKARCRVIAASSSFYIEKIFTKIYKRFNPLMHNVPKWSDTL